jgi:hypothetical protein
MQGHSVDNTICASCLLHAVPLLLLPQQNYVVEFKWRPETVVEYMSSPGSSTSSGLARVAYDYYDPDDADGDIVDTLKFRLVLKPDNAGTLNR